MFAQQFATLLSSNICFRLNSYILSLNYVLVVDSGLKTELQIILQNFKLFENSVASLKFNTLHS
jgi:hypothetical protein